nr:uncharacterized protein LOC117279374 [Nicotiana tomentosiformis]
MPETHTWKELAIKYGWKAKSHGLPQGSAVVPEDDILAGPTDATRLLHEAFNRASISGSAFGASASSRSPQPENKQQKKRRSFAAGRKNKKAKNVVPEPSTDVLEMRVMPELVLEIMVIDDGEASDDVASLHRRR